MLKKMSTLFLALLFVGSLLAQSQPMKKAPVVANEPTVSTSKIDFSSLPQGQQPKASTWVLVDSMANSYGPAIGTINPLAYDPYTNTVAFVNRSLASLGGSGALYYSFSTNKGASWVRATGPLNTGTQSPLRARYPSMSIANPTKASDLASAMAVFAWPALDNAGSGFDLLGYGADQPLGAGASFAAILDANGKFSSQTPIWAGDGNNYVFWTVEYSDTPAGKPLLQAGIYRTADFQAIDSIIPACFDDVNNGGMVLFGGAASGNTQFIAMATRFDDTTGTHVGWWPAYIKSTDNGTTWSDRMVIDFTTIPSLKKYESLWDYKVGDSFVSYGGDLIADKNGNLHVVTALTYFDSVAKKNVNSIVELYQTATGWDGKVVASGMADTLFTIFSAGPTEPAIGQMGPSPYLAKNKAGDRLAIQWVSGTNDKDTICDIFIATRSLAGTWSNPINITQTPLRNENGSHFAPYLEGSGENYTAFSAYWYAKNSTTYQMDPAVTAVAYAAATPLVISGNDVNVANNKVFALEQNYPNPFNPSTAIRFSLNGTENVTLKVYDVLGREVATLLNSRMERGAHVVNFDGSNLASGMYMYKLEAGATSAVKKMMLLK